MGVVVVMVGVVERNNNISMSFALQHAIFCLEYYLGCFWNTYLPRHFEVLVVY